MPKEIRPDHVAIYIRWSTEDQSDGTTLAVQSEACRAYVQSQGWQVREDLIFIDDGYSGGSLERPGMTALRKRIRAGEIDCVVVFKLDRLSRSVLDTVTLVLREWEGRTYLKSAREPVDTTTAMGKQFFYMLVSYAEWERNVIRERMFSGKLRRAREGRSPGMPLPYGYKKGPTPGTAVVVPEEAEVVRRVFDLAEQGSSVRQITIYLNQNGIASRRGAPWGTSMVSKMLHNPIYTGKLVWGRRRKNPLWGVEPGARKLTFADPHVVTDTSIIPAIVSQDQFDRVQRLMEDNSKIVPAAAGSEHLLTGLIHCDQCGKAMQFNGYGGQWAYYRCSGRTQHKTCTAPAVPARDLEVKVVEELTLRYATLIRQGEVDEDSAQGALRDLQSNFQALSDQLRRLENQERRINQDYRQERLTAQDRKALLGEVESERSALHRRMGEVESEIARVRDGISYLQQFATALQGVNVFRELPMVAQKQVLRHMIKQIRARRTRQGIEAEITWVDLPSLIPQAKDVSAVQ